MAAFPSNWENLERSLRADVESQIVVLLAAIGNLNTLSGLTDAQITTNIVQAIRTLATAQKVIARQVTRLSRLAVAGFDSADTGT
jgi:hypothetical protein